MMPMAPGSTAPAMPGDVDKLGKDMRGRLQAGLILALMEIAMPNLTDPDDKIAMEEAHLKMLRHFTKTPSDLGQAELKFMQSQLSLQPSPSAMDQGPDIQQRLASMGVGQQMAPPGPMAA